jgi:hypothetical protein
MLILFYGEDGEAGKARLKALKSEGIAARLYHATACREAEPAQGVEFLHDVTEYERSRLEALFGFAGHRQPPFAPPPPADPAEATERPGKGPGGRWYVKRGREIMSGPYASEDDAASAIGARA